MPFKIKKVVRQGDYLPKSCSPPLFDAVIVSALNDHMGEGVNMLFYRQEEDVMVMPFARY